MVTTDPLRQGSAKACSKCACWAQPTRLPRACPMDSVSILQLGMVCRWNGHNRFRNDMRLTTGSPHYAQVGCFLPEYLCISVRRVWKNIMQYVRRETVWDLAIAADQTPSPQRFSPVVRVRLGWPKGKPLGSHQKYSPFDNHVGIYRVCDMIGGQKYMIGFHFLIFRTHDPSLMLEFKQGLPWSGFLGTGFMCPEMLLLPVVGKMTYV